MLIGGSFSPSGARHRVRCRRTPQWPSFLQSLLDAGRLVLRSVCQPPFEPIREAELRWLSAKMTFQLAITSAKRVGELHALSVSQMCMFWYRIGSGLLSYPIPPFCQRECLPRKQTKQLSWQHSVHQARHSK